MALFHIPFALSGIMAHSGESPHIMHRPDHRFARNHNLIQILKGKHTLIDPVKMNHISLLKLGQRGYIRPRIGYIN